MKKFYSLLLMCFIICILLIGCGDGHNTVILPGNLTPTPSSNKATISGTVYKQDGTVATSGYIVTLIPVSDTSKISSSENYGEKQTTYTNANGHYSLTVSFAGTYLIEAKTPDGLTLLGSQGFTVKLGSSIIINLGLVQGPTGGTGPSGPPGPVYLGALTVTVQDASESKPIGNATVSLIKTGLTGASADLISLDSAGSGTYTFNNLAYGDYEITVEVQGYEKQTRNISITGVETINEIFTLLRLTVLVSIPGGTFQMGGTQQSNELPFHPVTVSPFYIGDHEVTNAEFCAFLNVLGNQLEGSTTIRWFTVSNDDYCGITGSYPFTVKPNYENRPVVYVNWYGSVAYCNWLSTRDGFTPCYGDYSTDGSARRAGFNINNNGYRLPTEAEWEYACKAGSTTDYYWGENYNNPVGSPFNIGNYAWYSGNSGSPFNHHPVKTLLPNNFNLYDMSGNVWENCHDWYASYDPDSATNPTTDPTGPPSGTHIVICGGDFDDAAIYCRSGHRNNALPASRSGTRGFRIVRR